tara:strand:+ start:3373 stop:3591 length:219 start_codon:yes stop_codon:yes gene_type:complete
MTGDKPSALRLDIVYETDPKKTTDDALVQEFLKKGGKISVGKTKPLPSELGLSNNAWNNKLTREEKSARDGK